MTFIQTLLTELSISAIIAAFTSLKFDMIAKYLKTGGTLRDE